MRSSHAFVGTGLDTIPEPEQREFRPRSERILSANRENYRLNRACSQSRPNRAMAYWGHVRDAWARRTEYVCEWTI